MVKGRNEKFRKNGKAWRERKRKEKVSHIQLIGKFDPDNEFHKRANVIDKITIKECLQLPFTEHLHSVLALYWSIYLFSTLVFWGWVAAWKPSYC